jgi:hypothetical protein
VGRHRAARGGIRLELRIGRVQKRRCNFFAGGPGKDIDELPQTGYTWEKAAKAADEPQLNIRMKNMGDDVKT